LVILFLSLSSCLLGIILVLLSIALVDSILTQSLLLIRVLWWLSPCRISLMVSITMASQVVKELISYMMSLVNVLLGRGLRVAVWRDLLYVRVENINYHFFSLPEHQTSGN
jgi:hypothetical protein